ncbi:MAG: hypothetical protein GSR73_01620 [Desulfurococcales archaeon]|nr:hypothetical protein [Desulfurococcales archaeon]
MSIWSPQPLINTVYETLLALSKNGEIPVSETDVIAELKRRGEDISRRDLAKILMTLEILGYISTQLSKKELIVKVNAKR